MIGGGAGVLIALVLPAQGIPPHRPIPPEELATKAAVAGVATVVRSEVRRDEASGGIFTDYHLRFHEVWKGVPGPGFILTQYGGTIGDRSAAIPGWTYTLRPAEKFIVFAVPQQGLRHTVIGMRQGLYRISPGDPSSVVKDTESALPESDRSETSFENLRRRVHAATGRALPETAPPPATEEAEGATPPPAPPAGPDPRSAAAPAPPADPGRSAGLLLALLLLMATITIGWTQWRRKTETAR